MIDLDHFKQVRLRPRRRRLRDHTVADALKATSAENEIVARGEELVMAILGADEAESLVAADRVRAAIAAIADAKWRVTVGIGVAAFKPGDRTSRCWRQASASPGKPRGQ